MLFDNQKLKFSFALAPEAPVPVAQENEDQQTQTPETDSGNTVDNSEALKRARKQLENVLGILGDDVVSESEKPDYQSNTSFEQGLENNTKARLENLVGYINNNLDSTGQLQNSEQVKQRIQGIIETLPPAQQGALAINNTATATSTQEGRRVETASNPTATAETNPTSPESLTFGFDVQPNNEFLTQNLVGSQITETGVGVIKSFGQVGQQIPALNGYNIVLLEKGVGGTSRQLKFALEKGGQFYDFAPAQYPPSRLNLQAIIPGLEPFVVTDWNQLSQWGGGFNTEQVRRRVRELRVDNPTNFILEDMDLPPINSLQDAINLVETHPALQGAQGDLQYLHTFIQQSAGNGEEGSRIYDDFPRFVQYFGPKKTSNQASATYETPGGQSRESASNSVRPGPTQKQKEIVTLISHIIKESQKTGISDVASLRFRDLSSAQERVKGLQAKFPNGIAGQSTYEYYIDSLAGEGATPAQKGWIEALISASGYIQPSGDFDTNILYQELSDHGGIDTAFVQGEQNKALSIYTIRDFVGREPSWYKVNRVGRPRGSRSRKYAEFLEVIEKAGIRRSISGGISQLELQELQTFLYKPENKEWFDYILENSGPVNAEARAEAQRRADIANQQRKTLIERGVVGQYDVYEQPTQENREAGLVFGLFNIGFKAKNEVSSVVARGDSADIFRALEAAGVNTRELEDYILGTNRTTGPVREAIIGLLVNQMAKLTGFGIGWNSTDSRRTEEGRALDQGHTSLGNDILQLVDKRDGSTGLEIDLANTQDFSKLIDFSKVEQKSIRYESEGYTPNQAFDKSLAEYLSESSDSTLQALAKPENAIARNALFALSGRRTSVSGAEIINYSGGDLNLSPEQVAGENAVVEAGSAREAIQQQSRRIWDQKGVSRQAQDYISGRSSELPAGYKAATLAEIRGLNPDAFGVSRDGQYALLYTSTPVDGQNKAQLVAYRYLINSPRKFVYRESDQTIIGIEKGQPGACNQIHTAYTPNLEKPQGDWELTASCHLTGLCPVPYQMNDILDQFGGYSGDNQYMEAAILANSPYYNQNMLDMKRALDQKRELNRAMHRLIKNIEDPSVQQQLQNSYVSEGVTMYDMLKELSDTAYVNNTTAEMQMWKNYSEQELGMNPLQMVFGGLFGFKYKEQNYSYSAFKWEDNFAGACTKLGIPVESVAGRFNSFMLELAIKLPEKPEEPEEPEEPEKPEEPEESEKIDITHSNENINSPTSPTNPEAGGIETPENDPDIGQSITNDPTTNPPAGQTPNIEDGLNPPPPDSPTPPPDSPTPPPDSPTPPPDSPTTAQPPVENGINEAPQSGGNLGETGIPSRPGTGTTTGEGGSVTNEPPSGGGNSGNGGINNGSNPNRSFGGGGSKDIGRPGGPEDLSD